MQEQMHSHARGVIVRLNVLLWTIELFQTGRNGHHALERLELTA
jgi:hypothetical protein